MDKLKFLRIQGFPILISDGAEIILGDYYLDFRSDGERIEHFDTVDKWALIGICDSVKIVFADPELNLGLPPLPDYKAWEVEQLAKLKYDDYMLDFREGFIAGYNAKKAEYTEEDLRKVYNSGYNRGSSEYKDDFMTEYEVIQSLKRDPSYIVMAGNEIKELIY